MVAVDRHHVTMPIALLPTRTLAVADPGTGWSLVDRLSAESFSHLGLVARPFEPAILLGVVTAALVLLRRRAMCHPVA
mgnify:CR=1 FL=1